jgi:hypothetical protein
MFRIHKIILMGLLLAGVCPAQEAGTSDQETIRQLVQEVKELQDKVKALEARQPGPAAAAPEAATAQPEPTEKPTGGGQGPTAISTLHDLRGIQWRGFGEVNYKVLDQRQPELGTFGFVPGSAGNFYTGDFDLFLTSRINDKASVLSEIVMGEGDAQRFGVDLERVLLKYDYDDHLKLSFGRYHTGIGYYNTAFHSGKWLQTTADRPLIMEFSNDGGLLPTQAVGVSVTGLIPSGKLGLNYIFEYGSSDTIRPDIDGGGAVDDENNGNHVVLGLFVRPDTVPGLQVGGSFYHDKISDSTASSAARQGQTIVNAHVVYVGHGFESLNEGFLIRLVSDQNGAASNMPAFYSQLSKRFGHIRPFVRYQYVNMNENKSIFDDVGLRYGPSFGARYDFNDNIAFKLQLDHTVRKGEPNLNGLQTQLAFTF